MGSTDSASPLPLPHPRANSPAPQIHLTASVVSAPTNGVAGVQQAQQQQQQQQRYRYQTEIQSMMYTFGDIRHPHPLTTLLVEDIVHAQLLDLLVKGTQIALRRGARVLGPEDLLFLIRHDLNRSQRLKEFLSWKDVRKNAKPASGSGPGANVSAVATSGATDSMAGGLLMLGQGDDAALVAELEEDAKQFASTEPFMPPDSNGSPSPSHQPAIHQSQASTHSQQSQQHPPARGSAAPSKSAAVQIGPKKRQLGLYWDLESALLADALPASVLSSLAESEELPCDSAHGSKATLRRLRLADLLTQSMSQAEYLDYSECRQASFTYKKSRKFRDWLLGGTPRPGSLCLGALAGGTGRELARLSDDVTEILGFLAYEAVQQLTETSLAVKYEQELLKARKEGKKGALVLGSDLTGCSGSASSAGSFSTSIAGMFANQRKEGTGTSLEQKGSTSSISTASTAASFTSTANQLQYKRSARPEKSPILPLHVEEAYRRLVAHNCEPFLLFKSTSPYRTRRLLI